MVNNRNATSSWSGYNHQGKVGIFLALNEINSLLGKKLKNDIDSYYLEFESAEDVDIKCHDTVVSRHQVKAKASGKYPNDYKNVRQRNSKQLTSGFQISGTDTSQRYLHVICEVLGWDLDQPEFNQKYPEANFIKNVSKVKLYQYPDKKFYCELIKDELNSPIDKFCIDEIKVILDKENHHLKDDATFVEEVLFSIKDLLSERISKSHQNGQGSYPRITFKEIFEIVVSTDRRAIQDFHHAKALLDIRWSKYITQDHSDYFRSHILNLPRQEFEDLIINLVPDEDIEDLKKLSNLSSLITKNRLKYILTKFLEHYKEREFLFESLKYSTQSESFRLSLIDAPRGEAGEVRDAIQNNIKFVKASFETDYLINQYIEGDFFEKLELSDTEELKPAYNINPNKSDSIFSNDLKFIDIDNTVLKLKEDNTHA